MSDLLKMGVMVLLFTISMYISHILASVLAPVLILVAAAMLTVLVMRVFLSSSIATEARYLGLIVVGVFVVSIIIAVLLVDLIKVIAWFLIGWYIFRVLLYLVAEDVYKDLDEFLNKVGGE